MKNKTNKQIKILSEEIAELEKEISLGKNIQENQDKIEDIMCSLSIEDMIKIDDYITKKELLK